LSNAPRYTSTPRSLITNTCGVIFTPYAFPTTPVGSINNGERDPFSRLNTMFSSTELPASSGPCELIANQAAPSLTQCSGISRNNRLLERHDAVHGAYWRTYDFDAVPQNLVERQNLLPDRRNLFAYPLGPGIGENLFQHAGGEIIFNLPNGLHGYMLINANNDEHLWAEDYDRDLTDVFAIQTDLAQKIAAALQAKLSPNEKARLDHRPTQNPEAYLLFVQAHDTANRAEMFHDTSLKAEPLFEQAIKLDPNFAAAFAGLSMVESWVYHNSDPVPSRREKARVHADEALRLQPDLPEAHLALGFCYYYGDRDYERALAEFDIARRGLPNESQAYLAIGAIQRRQGKWAESNANLEKAATLDPKNTTVLLNLCFSYIAQRNFETADQLLDRAIAASPQAFQLRALKGFMAVLWKGDLGAAEKVFPSTPTENDPEGLITWARTFILTLERKFPEALQVLERFRGEAMLTTTTAPAPKALLQGLIHRLQGDKTKAQPELEHARLISEKLLREAPEDSARHAQHGRILAALGQKQEAIAEGKRAVELLPESQDALDGPQATAALAEIYACTGEFDEAFRLLDHLFSVPSNLTVPILKLDPGWDPLRKDPRYQALIDKYGPKN
jgi:serine/threonine-protein kinase